MSVLQDNMEFSDAQALASISSAATTVATSTVDMLDGGGVNLTGWGGAKNPEIGGLQWNVNVSAALVGAGAALTVSLVTKASASSMSSGATTIGTITIPALTAAGTRYSVKFAPGQATLRHLGVLYTASGGKLTSATVNSWLGLDNEVYD